MSQESEERRLDRRTFLTGTAALGAGLVFGGQDAFAQDAPKVATPRSANDRIRFACIGIDGKGRSDTADAARFGDIVAICDVDEDRLEASGMLYPNAKRFTDYRKMFDAMANQIDAVTVSTPDHHHFAASSIAMLLGKHTFCQKPLVHSLHEARRMQDIAKRMKVQTQMGNQGTADPSLRKQAAQLRKGIIGNVQEIHVWTNRPIWPQGMPRPAAAEAPGNLAWDLWLGPAPMRPYGPGYHSFSWRGWWDFGTGALGDMGCHTLNMPFMGLDLRNPYQVTAETSGHNNDSYPSWSIIKYEFHRLKRRQALTMYWYDGNKKPSADLLDGRPLDGSGSLLIGDKGKIYIPGDYGSGGQVIGGVDVGEVEYEVSPGHFAEFVRAIREGKPAMSNFPGYAGPLTETVILGNLAVRAAASGVGPTIEWDHKRQRIRNRREVADNESLQAMIRPTFRAGWKLV